MVGADFGRGSADDADQGKVVRLGAWNYAAGKWQMIDYCEAASVYERVEDAINRAYHHYCESRK